MNGTIGVSSSGHDGDVDRACKHVDVRSFEIGCRDHFGSAEPGSGKDGCATTENLAYSSVRGDECWHSSEEHQTTTVWKRLDSCTSCISRRTRSRCVALLNEILG